MKKSVVKNFLVTGAVFLLYACFAPQTPQEVARAFWTAVINDDARQAAEYSTLARAEDYDAFSRNWQGLQPSWGRIVLDGNEASIVTRFADPTTSEKTDREFVTYLVHREDRWKVDYERTGRGVRGGTLGELIGKLSQLGNDLSKQYESSLKDFQVEMERLGRRLEEMADTFGQQAAQSIERYAEELQRSIEQLRESINRALQEQERNMPEHDRRILTEVSADLERNSRNLSRPDITAVAEGGRNIGRAQQRLASIDSGWSAEYREQWHALSAKLEQDVQRLLQEISATPRDGR